MRSYPELVTYSSENALPLDQVVREELQRLILRYLSERGFFVHGVFQGGTSIRLVYGGTRFSEDLDFVLRPGKTIIDLNLAAMLEGLPSFVRREVPFAERSTVKEQKTQATFARYRCRIELQAPLGGLVINLEFSGVPGRSPRPHVMRSDTVDVAIVYIHGGGWVLGTKSGDLDMIDIQALVEAGFLVAAIDYRLSPEYRFPTQVEDVKCAVRYVRSNAAE